MSDTTGRSATHTAMAVPVVDVMRAADFAARKHVAQRRKGQAAEPYVNHLTEVALLVAEATEGKDPTAVMAALLHDSIEDVGVTRDDLAREFSPEVASLVVEVTDDKKLPKPQRKQLQIEHAPHLSPQAKLIKIADKISNLRAIRSSPPPWDDGRKQGYFAWAKEVVDGCRQPVAGAEAPDPTQPANRKLALLFDEAHAAGWRI